jgi:small subunit ribosomal protein S6
MAKPAPLYDLVLLLSVESDEAVRAKIVADVESTITSAGGQIERNDEWGRRAMTFEIDHQGEADYRLIQFHGPTSLLESLTHNLGIADGVLRFRIIKVVAGTPPAPDPRAFSAPAAAVSAAGDSSPDE